MVADHPPNSHAFVFLVKFSREPQPGEHGTERTCGSHAERTDSPCAKDAVIIAGSSRALGWSTRGHVVIDVAGRSRSAGRAARGACSRLQRPWCTASSRMSRSDSGTCRYRSRRVCCWLLNPRSPSAPDRHLAPGPAYRGCALRVSAARTDTRSPSRRLDRRREPLPRSRLSPKARRSARGCHLAQHPTPQACLAEGRW